MNTNTDQQNNHAQLKAYLDAVHRDEPTQAETDQAQRRLMQRLDHSQSSKRAPLSGWRWATAAVLALVLMPLIMVLPGSGNGVAFAQVQAYFNSFNTMTAELTTRMNGDVIMGMDIAVDEQNRTRLDAGSEFSYIIDPNQETMLQLFHPQQRALLVPLSGADEAEQSLDWLEDIRRYQGEAVILDETRSIQGEEAYGFALREQGLDMVLWANDLGRPLLLEFDAGAGPTAITTTIEFHFDEALDPQRFELIVPSDYTLLDADHTN